MKKERVDVLLVKQGLFSTREQAKRAVMAGEILGENEERLDKPGMKISVDTELHFKGTKMPYVSRGGLKLEKALKVFKVDAKNKTMLDIGSSTGGFTDVALQKGAKLSYALDVGTNQLAWKLRQDDRVVVMENTNFRYSKLEDFTKGQPDLATIDVSFISLQLILPTLHEIIQNNGDVIALIKPQFEAGKEKVGKHGIVRDPYRAVTNNKGIMNGADAVLIATGNDYRAIEAATAVLANHDGQYRSLSKWTMQGSYLVGELTLPMAIGVVGGSIKARHDVQQSFAILGQRITSKTLAEIIVSVALANNLAALLAISTVGIQAGHMKLQARNVVAELTDDEHERKQLLAAMISEKNYSESHAKELLAKIRKEK